MNSYYQLSSAFGLSSAAGLNAYIPLLLTGLLANRGYITLTSPYDTLASPWCIVVLILLCIVELIVDKIPGADHINDIIQTIIRPTAGAILFAAQAGTISSDHPLFFIILGLLTAGAVHGTKSLARPVINLTTFGIGAPIASSIENLVSTTLSIVAILAPILVFALMITFGWILIRAFRRFTSKSRPIRINARPVRDSAELPVAASTNPSTTWRGGL